MPALGPQQPIPGDFRSNDVISGSLSLARDRGTFRVTSLSSPASYSLVGREMYSILQFLAIYSRFKGTCGEMTSLPVIWGHVMSFPVTLVPPPASYSLVGSEMCSLCQFSALYSYFQVTSGQMTSLPCHFQSPEVAWRHFLSRNASCEVSLVGSEMYSIRVFGLQQQLPGDYHFLQVTALYELKRTQNSTYKPSQPLPGHFQSNDVTSGSLPIMKSRDVISCHTTNSCVLQTCRSSKVPKTRLTGHLQPLPGDFRSNDITSGSLPVMWGHVTSFPVTWWPPPASYSPLKVQTYPKHDL